MRVYLLSLLKHMSYKQICRVFWNSLSIVHVIQTNRIYIYCTVVTEKSTNPSCQIHFVHAEACRGMDK